MFDHDVLVVGSGPCGVHAAGALADAGLSVAILDGGRAEPASVAGLVERDYLDVRRHDREQHRLFLGEDFSGIALEAPECGVQLAGNRGYVLRDADAWLPLEAHGARVRQSLAVGGLGAAWGGECAFLDAGTLWAMGLDPAELEPFEEQVARRIGISGPPGRLPVQPESRPDLHVEQLLARAGERAESLRRAGMRCERSRVAALTRPLGGRLPLAYTDMEYFQDRRRSVWRPQHMLEELRSRPRVQHLPGFLARRVLPLDRGCALGCIEIDREGTGPAGRGLVLRARKLVLALGAVGSARLLLHSLDLHRRTVPLLAKDRSYIVCLHPRTFGKAGSERRTSLCQLVLSDQVRLESGLHASHTQLYAYRSFQLFRLLGGLPLPVHASMRLLSLVAPSLLLADMRHAASPDSAGLLRIQACSDGGHRAEVLLERGAAELRTRRSALARVRASLRHLGLLPVAIRAAAPGAASHYAGTLPRCDGAHSGTPLSTHRSGALRQLRDVHIADASTFLALSAAPPTFTMMANARRVATAVARELADSP